MFLRPVLCFILIALSAGTALAEDDCPKKFENYGIFLQAKKACAREVEYPFMKAMKACAKETPEPKAVELMDTGRRIWARNLMRSSLGTICEEVFSRLPAAPRHHKH